MQHISTTPFGRRPVDCGILASQILARSPAPYPSADKWTLFEDLRTARSRLSLSDRDLTVLNALLSFLPGQKMADGNALVVFPSNRSLTARAHGMPESTLRRHLSALIAAGVIARNDSPNGKRYARKGRDGAIVNAYGFSLRPLLVRAAEIAALAEEIREEGHQLSLLRETVVLKLRDIAKLCAYAAGEGLPVDDLATGVQELRNGLRRKLSAPLLAKLDTLAEALLHRAENTLRFPSETTEMSVCDSQNERHYQSSNPESSESEPAEKTEKPQPGIPLRLVTDACPDIETFGGTVIRNWHDLIASASRVRAMMGIASETWEGAMQAMGPVTAAMAVAAILQRMSLIRSPGAYLRSLSLKAEREGFSAVPMIMALLSPANRKAA